MISYRFKKHDPSQLEWMTIGYLWAEAYLSDDFARKLISCFSMIRDSKSYDWINEDKTVMLLEANEYHRCWLIKAHSSRRLEIRRYLQEFLGINDSRVL